MVTPRYYGTYHDIIIRGSQKNIFLSYTALRWCVTVYGVVEVPQKFWAPWDPAHGSPRPSKFT